MNFALLAFLDNLVKEVWEIFNAGRKEKQPQDFIWKHLISTIKHLRILLIGMCIFLAIFPASAQQEKSVESKITDVTVFLSKAQITRNANFRIDAGKSTLAFTGLPSNLDQQSIQVSGKGTFVILGISSRQNYLNEVSMPKSLHALKDSLENFQMQIQLEQSQLEILNKEEQMLLSNQRIGGTNQNLTVAELKSMADFYRTRLGDIVSTRMKQNIKIKKLNERVVKLQQQFTTLNELLGRNTTEILVDVTASSPTNCALEVSYIVANAGWRPIYDLRAIDTKNPVQLNYKANVFQSTGEDWRNVKLKLSTTNPNLGGIKPEIYTWYLDFYYPNAAAIYGSRAPEKLRVRGMSSVPASDDYEKKENGEAGSVADSVTTVQTSLSTEFDIAIPYTVPSSNKPTLVDIASHELTTDYQYSVAPKLDLDAFLMARITGWEDYNLLPGEANIFFEGTFVARSFINPNNINDTLSVSLGRDKRIVVKREKMKDYTSRKSINSNQRDSYAYEISVRNTKKEPVNIIIEDHVPVSQNSQIEVTATDTGNAKYLKETGRLNWVVGIQPNENKKVAYKFEVKYPKGTLLSGL